MLKVITARLHPPKPSSRRFDGLTILIVGASTGIGLEAAKKLAAQGTSTLIITARDEAKAATTKATIEEHLASIYGLVSRLKQKTNHLDHAIISAGLLAGSYEQAETGYESSLQVNAISPTLLSTHLLPLLLNSPLVHKDSVAERPHLTLVSSGAAWLASRSTIEPIISSPTPLRDLSRREAFTPGVMGGQRHYCLTKLMLEYSMRHLAFLPHIEDAEKGPRVLIASVCPGAVNSDLSRHSANSGLVGMMAKIVNNTVARTAEQGANIYISSLGLGEEGRGQMWTDDHISKDHKAFLSTPEGKQLGDRVVQELQSFVREMDTKRGI
ncbi:short-chain dehydrogenase reductase [Colletotrichum kahawae]|uniref:Short-chain dehydrogenase reductase n=1 Tax=Colletotrichum kahawae TaxID=34407 RepID=A0AAD9XVQ2_COLKA|nr:short-chain dehydrogenase reductase [Colletotrichum kahawae]